MKKLFLYMLLGLLWCNVGVTETDKITTYKCKEYLTTVDPNGELGIFYNDDVATLIVTETSYQSDEWGSGVDGEVELIYKNYKTKFIIKNIGFGDSFTAYRYNKIDNERIKNTEDSDWKKLYKKNKGKLANLEFLKFEYNDFGGEAPNDYFELHYITNAALWTMETDINQIDAFVDTFYCKK
jgi:hypothetical protein